MTIKLNKTRNFNVSSKVMHFFLVILIADVFPVDKHSNNVISIVDINVFVVSFGCGGGRFSLLRLELRWIFSRGSKL